MHATCLECDMEFSRKDALLRHKRNGIRTTQPYPQSSDVYPPSSQAYPPPPPPEVALQHPLTLMAIGPIFSGKSCWMNRLLIHANTMINPPPEHIIWCCKRWQPQFSEMQSTIKNILFLQGLPENLTRSYTLDIPV